MNSTCPPSWSERRILLALFGVDRLRGMEMIPLAPLGGVERIPLAFLG